MLPEGDYGQRFYINTLLTVQDVTINKYFMFK